MGGSILVLICCCLFGWRFVGKKKECKRARRYEIYIQTTVTVDFAALQAINPDIVVLLRIPGVLKYPVVRGKDVVFRLPERTGLLGS